jgi:pentatricopeptide repeat protein
MEVHIIGTLCREGRLKEGMMILHDMDDRCIPVDSSTYASLLHACNKTKAFAEDAEGRR